MKKTFIIILLLASVPLAAQSTPRPPAPFYNSATGGLYLLYRFYHYCISSQDGPSCIYTPTCSAYAAQAISKHGVLAGTLLGTARLTRCNPSHQGGKDAVPETVFKK